MTNNDILKRIRYIFDFSDDKMISIFALAQKEVTRAEICDWLKSEEDPSFQTCDDATLALFLGGLITEKRGKREGPVMAPETQLNNNIIFNKLKIALAMKAEDVLETLKLAGMPISKHELSAFFRNPDHKHYRKCEDQILRNFLKGLQQKFRDI